VMHPLLDHFLDAAAAGRGASPEATAQLAAAVRACIWDGRTTLEAAIGVTTRGGPGGLSLQGKRAARDGLLRQARLWLRPLQPEDRAAARAILNIRDDLARRTNGPLNEVEDLLEAVMQIGVPIPDERQLARILGHQSD
jgi:hypothetical protein